MNNIQKDIIKYCTAKMSKGEGAGLLRRKVYAEIKEKMKDEAYKKAFNLELKNVNMMDFVKKADHKHTMQILKKVLINFKRLLSKGFRFGVLIFGIYYVYNKDKVDAFVCNKVNKVINFVNKKYSDIKFHLAYQKKIKEFSANYSEFTK